MHSVSRWCAALIESAQSMAGAMAGIMAGIMAGAIGEVIGGAMGEAMGGAVGGAVPRWGWFAPMIWTVMPFLFFLSGPSSGSSCEADDGDVSCHSGAKSTATPCRASVPSAV